MNSIVKNKNTYYVLGILFVFVLWIIGEIYFNNDYILPGVGQTFESLFELLQDGHTYYILGHTLVRILLAVSICFVLGTSFAVLSNISLKFKSFLKPIMTLLKTLPLMVIIILLLFMLDDNAFYYIVGLVIFPIIYEGVLNGLESIDKNMLEEVRMFSNINMLVIKDIYLPLTLPHILTSLLQSFGLGLKVLVMAEFISNASPSIGNEIIYYKNDLGEMSYVYAWSIILVLFVLIIDLVINILKKRSLV